MYDQNPPRGCNAGELTELPVPLTSPEPATLPQQVQLALIQAALAKQETVVAEPGSIDHLLIHQNCVHHAADLYQLLSLATVAGEARNLARSNRSHFSQTDFGDHALESSAGDQFGSGSSQFIIHDFNLAPSQFMQTLFAYCNF